MRRKRHAALVAACALIALSGLRAQAQITVSSLADLRTAAAANNNSTITLTAGEYWLDGTHIADPTNSEPIFLELGGSNNTYVLDGANLNVDTRSLGNYGRNLGHESAVIPVKISGSDNSVQGLSVIGQDIDLDTQPDAKRHADWGTTYVQFKGDNNSLTDAYVVTRGSSPYGLGDAFGKGARNDMDPYISHRKAAGIQVHEATNAYFSNIDLDINTYGHGFFVQKSSDTTLENATITGELAPSSNVIDHELYQEHGHTWWGGPIHEDVMISAAEDGVRAYGTIDGVSVTNMTVRNVVVTNMRTGFATAIAKGDILLENVESYGAETNFAVGRNHTVINGKGDMVNGPLYNAPYDNVSNTSVELELVGEAPVGKNWNVGYITGDNVDVSISSSLTAEDIPEDSYVRLGQVFYQDWRDWQTTDPNDKPSYDLIDSTFTNNTSQMLIMGINVSGNVGSSQAPVISNGQGNYYDGVTLVPSGIRTDVVHASGLGNSGTELGAEFDNNGNVVYTGTSTAATFDDNGTIIEDGATLEIQPSVQVYDERVTITGNGVDGLGAIYTDGSTDNKTRLVNGDGSEEMIILDGDASIGVGNADGQLLVTRLSGTGNFTKLGAGTLAVERYSSFIGEFIIAEGIVAGRSGTVTGDLRVLTGATIGAKAGAMLNAPNGAARIDGQLDLNFREDDNYIAGVIGSLAGSGQVTSSNPFAGSGGSLEITGDTGTADFSGTMDGTVSVIKSGTNTQTFSGMMTHTGTTTVDNGVLLINGTHTGGEDYSVHDGGTLGGTGTIDADVTVASSGSLAPGASVGVFEVGDVALESGSTFEVEVDASASDRLIANSVDLMGSLSISLVDDGGGLVLPSSLDSFEILNAATSLDGVFENAATNGARLDTVGGEGSFSIVYISSLGSVYLTDFLSAQLAGDYNADGVVDAADYTVWRESLGQGTVDPFTGADGDGDGQITPDDYLVWSNNFGATAPVSSVAVPEPSALLLAALACVAFKPALPRPPVPGSRRLVFG